MESTNQSSEGSHDSIEAVPLFVTYLKMLLVLVMSALIITPALIVVWIIKKTEALHTKYYCLVANLLVTDIVQVFCKFVSEYLVMITYLLGLNTDTAGEILLWLTVPITTMLFIVTSLLFVSLAVERVVVIGYPYRHRSIMTTKVVRGMVLATWLVSAIAAAIVVTLSPYSIQWPFGTIFIGRSIVRVILILPFRICSAGFITAANVFLYYKVQQSNKKAEKNMRAGSAGEEEAYRLKKLIKKLNSQTKTVISLLLLGGIDGISILLTPVLYILLIRSLGPTAELYALPFFSYILQSSIRMSHSLVYGFYMKQIRERLPRYNICPYSRRTRVIDLNQ